MNKTSYLTLFAFLISLGVVSASSLASATLTDNEIILNDLNSDIPFDYPTLENVDAEVTEHSFKAFTSDDLNIQSNFAGADVDTMVSLLLNIQADVTILNNDAQVIKSDSFTEVKTFFLRSNLDTSKKLTCLPDDDVLVHVTFHQRGLNGIHRADNLVVISSDDKEIHQGHNENIDSTYSFGVKANTELVVFASVQESLLFPDLIGSSLALVTILYPPGTDLTSCIVV